MVLELIFVFDDSTLEDLEAAEGAAGRNAEECRREAERWDRVARQLDERADKLR